MRTPKSASSAHELTPHAQRPTPLAYAQKGVLSSRGCALALGSVLTVALLAVLFVFPLGAWASGSCPNEAFRTGPSAALPDCRAYEQVTPVFKDGSFYEVRHTGGFRLGETPTLVLESYAAIAGIESDYGIKGGIYSTTRTKSGWMTVPDPPSATEYTLFNEPGSATASFVVSMDGRSTVWLGRRDGQPDNRVDFFVRRPEGAIEDVGPITPPGSPDETSYIVIQGGLHVNIVDASDDLSHILFQMQPYFYNGFHFWPFDETEEKEGTEGTASLYEFVGAGNTEPMVVGVGNDGKLISRCGTIAGAGESVSLHNAISGDGDTVFFTAIGGVGCGGVNELYARIDNGQSDAHTVAISEPSLEDCEECDTEPGVRAPASFMGASEDGSKVFFTTTQRLLGNDTSSNIYEYDFDAPAGHRVVRVSGGDATVSNPVAEVQDVLQTSEDGSHVYFTAHGVLTTVPNNQAQTAQAGADNLYVFERDALFPAGHISFIADASVKYSDVTPEGGFMVFISATEGLTPDDYATAPQVFEYNSQTGSLVRVSIGQNGYNDNGNTDQAEPRIAAPDYAVGEPTSYWSTMSVSADGSYVFFASNDGLTPRAIDDPTGEVFNVYEYHDGNVYLVTDGKDIGENVEFLGTDASGADVFFKTLDQLVPQDTDTNLDIYDARIDGGFPAPAPQVECSGDGCQGPLSAAPVLLSPGSEYQVGESGLTPVAPTSVVQAKAGAKAGKKSTKKRTARRTKKKRGARKATHGSHARGRGGRS